MKNRLCLFAGCILMLVQSCQSPSKEDRLAWTLQASGSNRHELEKVLAHYSQEASDSLKLKAARFLIENMPGHYSYYGEILDNYLDSIHHSASLREYPWHLRNMFLIQAYRNPMLHRIQGVEKIEDIHRITADYLIDNIERAFLAWEKPWARHLSFEDFCEYLLPYRVENEPLMHWRDSLDGTFDEVFKSMETVDELFESPYQACLRLNSLLMSSMEAMQADSASFFHPLIGTKEAVTFGCPEFVYAVIFAMRSAGVPVSIETIEQWSSRGGKHYWNAVYHFTGLRYPFTGYDSRPRGLNQDYKMNKVYRCTYAGNINLPVKEGDKGDDEPIPPLFLNPFLKDVTQEYMTCHDITVKLNFPPEEKRKYAYLCVFNNETWVPVHIGKINGNTVTFTRVGPQTMFVACYYADEEIIPASWPFHVELNGKLTYIIPDSTYQSIRIERKSPLYHRFANYSRHLVGATVEGADSPDFKSAEQLAVITHDANTMWDSLYISASDHSYRYIRLKNTRPMELAELEFYESGNKQVLPVSNILLPPQAISDKKESVLFNRSIGDFTKISHWIGFDFGRKVRLDKMRFCPRTDDNHVTAGHAYELYLYDRNDFRLLKRTIADSTVLVLDSIPVSGLYLLKDVTKGREHRIFTYEKGKVFFW